MCRTWRFLLVLLACAGALPAASILTCSFDGGPYSSIGCYNSPAAYTIETVDWLTALGSANQGAHHTVAEKPETYWNYKTPDGLTVSLTLGPPGVYQGTADTLLRVDNFYKYYDQSTGTWKTYNAVGSPYGNYSIYMGMFDSKPDANAGTPGDHLVGTSGGKGPLEIQFDRGINGIMFRISTPTSGDVNATIAAYAVPNPTASDTPIATYSIKATNAGGYCASLGSSTPVPCNVAPYIGIEGRPGDIRSVVITTGSGVYISTLYLDDARHTTEVPGNTSAVPEPGTWVLLSGSLMALGVAVRRRQPLS